MIRSSFEKDERAVEQQLLRSHPQYAGSIDARRVPTALARCTSPRYCDSGDVAGSDRDAMAELFPARRSAMRTDSYGTS
jgi:hypothetical protein